jgi:hypothetical protein
MLRNVIRHCGKKRAQPVSVYLLCRSVFRSRRVNNHVFLIAFLIVNRKFIHLKNIPLLDCPTRYIGNKESVKYFLALSFKVINDFQVFTFYLSIDDVKKLRVLRLPKLRGRRVVEVIPCCRCEGGCHIRKEVSSVKVLQSIQARLHNSLSPAPALLFRRSAYLPHSAIPVCLFS